MTHFQPFIEMNPVPATKTNGHHEPSFLHARGLAPTPPARGLNGEPDWSMNSAYPWKALGFGLYAIVYYYAFQYGMSFSRACASPFWFPDTVLLCALLLNRPRYWWAFVLMAIPIRVFHPVAHGLPAWFLLATCAIDSARGLFAAVVLRRILKNPVRLGTVREFVQFCLIAVLLAPAASAFGGAAVRQVLGYDYWTTWGQWFIGVALAQLVLTPAVLYWLVRWPWKIRMPSAMRCLEAGVLGVGLLLAGYLSFSTGASRTSISPSLSYAPVPLMFWAAIRFGMAGASGAILVITFFSVEAAIHPCGIFIGQSPAGTALALQNFLLLRAAPLYLVALLVEQQNDTQRSLRESEERFRTLADTAPVLLWMTGTDKLCEFVNRGWLDFTGRTMEQELGNGWAQGVHREDVEHCLQLYHSSFDARQPCEIEYRLRRHDGEYRWVLDRGVPRRAPNGDFIGYVGTVIDITDRKLAEEARQELVHASRLAVMGEFTAVVAHELSNPLNAILSNTEAAARLLNFNNASPEQIRDILADIRHDDLRATKTIGRIRSLLRKREMELEPLDMNKTVCEILQFVKWDAARRRVQIHMKRRVPLPTARGDAVHLQQVILNLVLNGMDAMKDNPESERHLFVTTDCTNDGFVEVAVKDVGHGIPPENLSRVFDSFFTTKTDGIGIGLSIANSIVQFHSGRLWAETNKDGRGTTFRFIVPTLSEDPTHRTQVDCSLSPT